MKANQTARLTSEHMREVQIIVISVQLGELRIENGSLYLPNLLPREWSGGIYGI